MLTISTNYGTAIVYIITNFGIVLFWLGMLFLFLNAVKGLILSIFSLPNNSRAIIFAADTKK